MSLASEAQPHWRTLARLTGQSEPNTDQLVGRKAGGKKKKNRGIVFETETKMAMQFSVSALKVYRMLGGGEGGMNREREKDGLALEKLWPKRARVLPLVEGITARTSGTLLPLGRALVGSVA